MNLDSVTLKNNVAPATPKSNLPANMVPGFSVPAEKKPEAAKASLDPAHMEKHLSQMMNELNQAMKDMNRNLNFSFDAKLNVQVVKVTSTTTGEVIRQIPSETVLKISHNLESIKGMLEDHKI